MPLSAIFQLYIMATSFSGGRSRITTDHGQETGKLYPCGCELSAPFFVIHKAGRIDDRLV
jgi:hypothetical protein